MVFSNPLLTVDGRTVAVQVVNRDRGNDLVLLKVAVTLEEGIKIKSDANTPELGTQNLGKILITAFPKDSISAGILSATYTDMPLVSSRGYLGAGAAYQHGKITLNRSVSKP